MGTLRKMKMKMKPKGGRRGAYHFVAKPNNIKGRRKMSPLITDTKPQACRIWVSLGEEEEMRKRVPCKCKI